jgi:hypothetical protein
MVALVSLAAILTNESPNLTEPVYLRHHAFIPVVFPVGIKISIAPNEDSRAFGPDEQSGAEKLRQT